MNPLADDDSSDPSPSAQRAEQYLLRLFVTGMTPRSVQAIARIKSICNEFLPGRHELEVIDIYQQPTLACGEQIIATPTLIRMQPLPLRRLVGDLSDRRKVLLGLDLLDVAGRPP